MKLLKILAKALVIIAISAAAAWGIITYLSASSHGNSSAGAGGGRPGGKNSAAIPVLVAKATTADVPVVLGAVGTVQAFNTVTVQAQVGGQLKHVLFQEGQDVHKGTVLATIDPVTYKAALDSAVAKKAQDEATLANARLDLDRYTKLAAQDYGSKQQADPQRALVAQLTAQVASDQAAIDTAQANLDFTKITAPIDGRIGIRLIDEGNILTTTNATSLATITQIKPTYVLFTLPEQSLAAARRAMAAGPVLVDAVDGDGKTVLDHGTLSVIDNSVDTTTGTVKLKAIFPNAQSALWPGSFVNINMVTETLKDALVVPSAAIQQGPQGRIVFLLGDNNTVSTVPVTIARQTDSMAVIRSGVKVGDTVVTSGFFNLTDGSTVKVSRAEDQAAPGDGDQKPKSPKKKDSTGGSSSGATP